LEGIDDFHEAFGAGLSDVHNWLNKVEGGFRFQNHIKEELTQQAEEDEEDEKKHVQSSNFQKGNKTWTPSVLWNLTRNTSIT
jgi:hypothetical protein